ncbi:restriction endonuclease subunit S, partial [Bacteroides uniformis]|uniref:restriction endonuclease subunit S n=3 Tax=Bacteroidales TaxID=171549 RepID=UPI001C3792AC
MNGKQLKNSILQWAIQGKLVPQDPNDEPASVLLERIRAEKARLVKEKKIKKDKNESIIYRGDDNSYYEKFLATGEVKCIDDEIPFEIPKGWEWCRLKHMCSMQAGKNISASEIYDKKSVLHPYRCVGGNGLRGFTNTFNAEGHFAIIGRQGALCGCLNIESGKFYATEHAVVVNGFGIIPSLFIYYFFTALNLNQYATATAQPGLAVSNIVEVFIPLPPLPEQLRIVSKIEKLLPLVKTYEQAQNGLNELNASLNEQLRKSILQEAIQGKLVPQCSDEGTAQELLEQIKLEKQKLIKDGKLKKSALTDSVIFKGDDNKYYE